MGKLTFGATGLSYQVDRPDLNVGGAPNCPRCSKRVYFNEERKLQGKSFHKACFSCASCRKSLDSTNVNSHDDEIYCTACHRRLFGIKGYGFAGGAAGLSTEKSIRDIYRPNRTSRLNSAGSTQNGGAPKNTTNGHTRNVTQIAKQSLSELSNKPNSTVFKAPLLDRENLENCPRCGKRVYFAEEVKSNKRKWHRLCFKCAECGKTLETGKSEAHEGEVYCNSCYARQYGPKGYGFASSMIAADPNPHFHVKKAYTSRTERRASGPNSPSVSSGSGPSSGQQSPAISPGYLTPGAAPQSPGYGSQSLASRAAPAPVTNASHASPASVAYEPDQRSRYVPESRDRYGSERRASYGTDQRDRYSSERDRNSSERDHYESGNRGTYESEQQSRYASDQSRRRRYEEEESINTYSRTMNAPLPSSGDPRMRNRQDEDNQQYDDSDVRESVSPVADTFRYNGEEWTDERIMDELNQFQQVSM